MHDDTVDRTTNGSGPLSQLHYSDLRRLDAAAKHRHREMFRGERVPTLKEAVEECIRNQLTIYFDVKGHADEAATTLKKMYKEYPVLYNMSIVCSFEPKVIYKHQWLQALDVLLDWAHHHLLWQLCGVSAFLMQKSFISPDYVQYWAERSVEVVAWTINTSVEKQFYQEVLGISYITDSLVEDCEPHY
ncbi:GDE1 phosphodiesterase, partial [Amia calva]|nr:GDE1 phosphodiesterase [Amia calva]